MYRKSKSMFGKLLLLLLTLCCAIVLLFGLAACSETKGIASAVINDNGELVITYTDGTSDNLGVVVGKDGEDGKDGQDGAPGKDGVDGEDGKDGQDGAPGKDGVDGEDGKDGADGRGISKVEFSADGTKLVITYTDNTTQEIAIPAYGTQCSHENVEYLVFEEHTSDKEGTYLRVCTDCGHAVIEHSSRHEYGDVKVVPPTCTTEGYTGKTCTICGHAADKTDIKEPLGHDWSDEHYVVEDGRTICEDGGMYVRVCSRCDLVDSRVTAAIGHRCEDWAVSTTPTAKNAGELTGTCENCGTQQKKTLPAFDSNEGKEFYTYTVTQEKEFCTDEGKGTYSFEIDGQSFSFEVTIAGSEHTLNGKKQSEWLNASEGAYSVDITGIKEFPDDHATCTEHGKGYYMCEECGEMVYVVTYKEHTVEEWSDKMGEEATCEAAGKQIGHCSVCDTEVERDVPALGHSYTYKFVKESDNTFTLIGTCTRDGSHVTTEKGLTGVKEESTPATCTQEGLIVYTYVKDGVELTIEETIPKKPHTLNGNPATNYANSDKEGAYDATVEGIIEFKGEEASCANGGTYGKGYYICEECGEMVFVNTYRSHVYAPETFEVTKEPTCTVKGEQKGHCTVCDAEIIEEISALGHDENWEFVANEDGTSFTLTVTCNRCQTQISQDTNITNVKKVVTKEATCSEEGEIVYTYTKDGKTVSVTAVVPKIAHTLNGKLATEWENADNCYDADMEGIFEFADDKATCENHGKGYYICEDCGEMVFVETFRGHSYDTSEIKTSATCTEDGVREFTCSTCGGTYTEKIPAKGHDYVVVGSPTLPTDSTSGQVVIECSREDCETTHTITLPALTDSSYKKQVIVEAACNKEGLIRYTYEYKVGEKVEYTFTFDIVVDMSNHEQSEDGKIYTWIVDGVKYTGYICETCDKMIVTKTEKVEDAA